MAKTKKTIELEEKLHYMTKKRRIYGCEEVTIGFHNNGHGNEVVDFCTMDSKGILRCYEIKVTLADLKSSAKKSWYGHFNYLFVTEELLYKIQDKLDEYIPSYVGVAIPCYDSWADGVAIVRNPKKQQISAETEIMLKESLIRSMYYKMCKYRDAADFEYVNTLKKDLTKVEKKNNDYAKENATLHYVINKIERILRKYYDFEVDFQNFVSEIENRKILLPTKIQLNINERGKKINAYITEDLEENN